jgi:gamma-glutamyltranspeptidase / glutathione hydrolase
VMPDDRVSNGAVVATSHPRAAGAALEVLKAGGNAVDASVAAMLAICVLQPFQVGLGGYGGAMVVYHEEKGHVFAIDFDSRAPLAFKPELYAGDAARAIHGPLAVSVPGVVAGLDLALREFGTKRWREVAAPALALADEGFAVEATLKRVMDELAKRADPESVRAMLPEGRVPDVGERWMQKDLATLLRKLGDDPAAFYRGEIPRAIVKSVRERGGILSEEDFTSYKARVVDPIQVIYRGHGVYTPPPPAGGLTTLGILKTLEDFEIGKLERWGAPYFELYCEASKLCWEERRRHLGDPDFVKPPVEELLSRKAAAARAECIRRGPWARPRQPATLQGTHTANIVAVDKHRNLVSLSATQGDTWGSRVAVTGLGLVLGHGMSRFTWPAEDPRSPNAPAPGKRMQHNMAPVVIVRPEGGKPKPVGAAGLPGGTKIVTVTGQLVISVLDFKATPGDAVRAPRVHTEGDEPLLLSGAVPEDVAAELELMGHQVKRRQAVGGLANVAMVSADGSRITAAAGLGPGGVATL